MSAPSEGFALGPVLERLRRLDPTRWGLPLSPENALGTWANALDALRPEPLAEPVAGAAPRRVLIVASANVYVAPLPWMLQLRARGVEVRVKAARVGEAAVRAMAEAVGGVEVRRWTGGDRAAEAEATADVDGVVVFGSQATLDAIRARLRPEQAFVGLGPKFGVAVVDGLDPALGEAIAADHTWFDGQGCMSPAAVFVPEARADEALERAAAAMAAAAAAVPPAPPTPGQAAEARARRTLGRALGAVREGPGWAVLRLPLARFLPVSYPRVLQLHPYRTLAEVEAAVAPWRRALGTVATTVPLDAAPSLAGAPRRCAPGWMQRPPLSRWHDGIDVLGVLWGARPA